MTRLEKRNQLFRNLMKIHHPEIEIAEPLDEGNGWRTLPEICQSVHMMTTGASDQPPEDYARELCHLRAAIGVWDERDSIPLTRSYDAAVKVLVMATLEEAEAASKNAAEMMGRAA